MDRFWANIFRQEDEPSVADLLGAIPLFEELTRSELSSIESILHRREYDTREVVFRQGNPGVGMYVIREGTVEIIYEPTGDTLAEFGPGDFFGELALLNETPRSATAITQSRAVLYGLFRPALLNLVQRDPSLGVQVLLRMARVVSTRLIHVNERVQELREQLNERPKERPET